MIKIGIFDSGIGGLDVVKAILQPLQSLHQPPVHFQIDYISDLAFCPYGTKTPEDIIKRVFYLTEQLLLEQADIIVVACNTATAYGIDALRQKYTIPFVGVEPFLNFIPQFLQQYPQTPFRPIVLLTPAMAQAKRFHDLKEHIFQPLVSTSSFDPQTFLTIPCPGLADFIENESFQLTHEGIIHFLKHYFSSHGPISSVHPTTHAILGCTHYPLIHQHLEEVLQATCVSPSPFVAKRVFQLLETIPHPSPQKKVHQKSLLSFQTLSAQLRFSCTQEDSLKDKKLKTLFPLSSSLC
jgi:glutamate racemase